ncbi:MAG TPA: bifunctional phosphoribosylaminoimidazolecarboxamide formyltransferase/IMP cyclohydrolase [Saprospiraceae bacterium]|nr:bifunctional phosphoribosylaminoimidazolecarboxamide formyltransferase/IMP cyclohydrolase [Saprospiraceae bacterium]
MSTLRSVRIRTALVSVFSKEGLEPIVRELQRLEIEIFSTGGTQTFIESLGIAVTPVEDITGYPSILDGRVKTLHPKIFGGILARREKAHLLELQQYEIPEIDLVVVDLYPFEKTVASTDDEYEIIEKIDIGGISLIRAAAKNFEDVVIVPSKEQYGELLTILKTQEGVTTLTERRKLARHAFAVSSHYDSAIFNYFNKEEAEVVFEKSLMHGMSLRYGENPHQTGMFYGYLDQMLHKLHGKELSYNNLVDIDGAVNIMNEFKDGDPSVAILKHTNACGVAVRENLLDAWNAALSCDPLSAFGGIIILNRALDLETAKAIDQIFYEVLIAPEFNEDALDFLMLKKNRILLQLKEYSIQPKSFKNLLNGVIEQDTDLHQHNVSDWKTVTKVSPTSSELTDLMFANKCVKHLKSNTIAIVKDGMLIGMGCGQTSRVDALKQAIAKAKHFQFDLHGAVMASDAFFPFPDCVAIAHEEGINTVVQPGGSVKDQESIDYCDKAGMAMMVTGIRHFKH